jgi:hypothetical protein
MQVYGLLAMQLAKLLLGFVSLNLLPEFRHLAECASESLTRFLWELIMSRLNVFRSTAARYAAVISTAVFSSAAFAQSADPFATALADVTTKVTTWAGALVGFAAVSVAFMVAIKYVKKIPKAS